MHYWDISVDCIVPTGKFKYIMLVLLVSNCFHIYGTSSWATYAGMHSSWNHVRVITEKHVNLNSVPTGLYLSSIRTLKLKVTICIYLQYWPFSSIFFTSLLKLVSSLLYRQHSHHTCGLLYLFNYSLIYIVINHYIVNFLYNAWNWIWCT